MLGETVPGQKRAETLLRADLQAGAVAHAYLFVGPSGTGRAALARQLAGALLCMRQTPDACGACTSCRAFASGSHPDYREAAVPEGKQEVPIDLIRSIQREASLKPALARRRVFVVRDAERMTPEAANCFLKTLEEPPGNACFILIATTLWDIPPTVVSRCRLVKLSGLPPERVEEELRAPDLSDDDAWWLARRSWGSPGRAHAFRDMGLHQFNQQLAEKLLTLSVEDNFALTDWLCKAIPPSAESSPEARSALQELLECVAVFYRDVAAAAAAPGGAELFNRALKDKISGLAARLPLDAVINCADRTLEAIERLGANANKRLTLDDLFTQLAGAKPQAAG